VEHNDIIHRLTEIQDCIRHNKTFDACVKIDSLQRMLFEEKLTSDNSDYAKSCDDCIYGVDGCQHEPPCTTGTGKPYFKKRDFA